MSVHVYRNRADDDRGPADLHFCKACNGWYGVPHSTSHCQHPRKYPRWRGENCACAECRTEHGQPIEGTHGFITDAPEWQP